MLQDDFERGHQKGPVEEGRTGPGSLGAPLSSAYASEPHDFSS